MSWWSGRALGFDFESDGPVPTEARAITCAMVRMDPGERPSELEVMIRPERPIPAEATAVHGITTERAEAGGQLRELALPSIAATIAEVADGECPVVGHNVVYDLTLLDRELRRLGLGRLEIERNVFAQIEQVRLLLGEKLLTTFPVIDTMVLDKEFDRYVKGAGMRKLEATARRYGVPMADGTAHGATADVIASLRIAITLANRGAFADRSLAALHCAQVRWKAEQARGLAKYWRDNPDKAKGDPDTVSEDWPLQGPGTDEPGYSDSATF